MALTHTHTHVCLHMYNILTHEYKDISILMFNIFNMIPAPAYATPKHSHVKVMHITGKYNK